MLRGARGVDELPDLAATEDLGEFLRHLGGGNPEVRAVAAERDVIQEPEGIDSEAAGGPGEFAVLDELEQLGLHLLVGQQLRRPPVVPRQVHDRGDVGRVVCGEKPRSLISRTIRARSSVIGHLHRGERTAMEAILLDATC